MKRKFAFFLFLFFLVGCATYQGAGSSYWHQTRLKEIETVYQNEEITAAEYLSLKNEADKIREEYGRGGYSYYSYYPYHYSYGYAHHYGHHHHGGHH